MPGSSLRIDKLLFFLRIAKSRTLAQDWVEAGHIRINGVRVHKASHNVHEGDVITLPKGEIVMAIKLLELPSRRGAPQEAQTWYQLMQ